MTNLEDMAEVIRREVGDPATIADIAAWAGKLRPPVSAETLRRWIRVGVLPARRRTPRGPYFLRAEDVARVVVGEPVQAGKSTGERA
jgi:hypothetical protein